MLDLVKIQVEAAAWQARNFGEGTCEQMALGMAEEVGELCHAILKRGQKIREGANGDDMKEKIADAFADVVIFGLQLCTIENIDAETAITETWAEASKRDWVNNPSGAGYSQHNQ